MGRETSIAWTDMTFNPWWGCTKVSPGCDHCYAETFDRRYGGRHWGKNAPRREFGDKHWSQPLVWNRQAERLGARTKVFCASMADVMDDEAPDGARERLWELVDRTPWLLWLLLTKRPHRYDRYLPPEFKHGNALLMATTENQTYYDVRWPELHRAAMRRGLPTGVSYEPALGPITLRSSVSRQGIPDWVVFGGESGNVRRPMEQTWAESIKAECESLGSTFFMKQMSARTPKQAHALIPVHLVSSGFPADLSGGGSTEKASMESQAAFPP